MGGPPSAAVFASATAPAGDIWRPVIEWSRKNSGLSDAGYFDNAPVRAIIQSRRRASSSRLSLARERRKVLLREWCLNKRRRLDIKNCSSREKRWLYCADDARATTSVVGDGPNARARAEEKLRLPGITCQLCAARARAQGYPSTGEKKKQKRRREGTSRSGEKAVIRPRICESSRGDLPLPAEARCSREMHRRDALSSTRSWACVTSPIFFPSSSLHPSVVQFAVSDPDLSDSVAEVPFRHGSA